MERNVCSFLRASETLTGKIALLAGQAFKKGKQIIRGEAHSRLKDFGPVTD